MIRRSEMKRAIFFLLLLLLLFIFKIESAHPASMTDYCITPPFTSTSVKPNVLIVMDFSGSMQFPANVPCTFGTYDTHDVAECGSSSSATYKYDSTKDYYGYFDKTKYYKHQSSKFQENTACTDTNKIGSSSSCISGNLLNWITSTRVDVTRKVLTGGRSNAGKLESEGAKYVYTDTTLHCKFTIDATGTANRQLTIASDGGTCAIAGLSSAVINLDDPGVTGIVHEYWDKVHFEFMVYSSGSGSYSRYGEMRADKDATQSSLLSAINNETPYWGTPTGEALWEAYDFFKQSNDNNYENNTSSINATNGNKDPWYDGSGGSATAIPCRKAFVLLLSDGAWNGSVDPVTPARTMLINDLRTAAALTGTQNARTYSVYAFGAGDTQGRQAMITTAIFGGFDDGDSNTWPYGFTAYPSDSRTVTYPRTECNYPTRWDSSCSEWDGDKDNLPDNFFEADDGDALKTALSDALQDMLRRATSGTAASMLSSSEGSGSNLIQAFFYPAKSFDTTEIEWIGEIQNLWYYLDPFLQSSSIREDTTADKKLKLTEDYVLQFYFDSDENKTKARRYEDTDGDGDADTQKTTVDIEDMSSLWKAGTLLHSKSASSRTIYTYDITNTFSSKLLPFTTSYESNLRSYLQAADSTEGTKIIDYIRGTDQSGYRNRTVTVGSTSGVWKLGDIISSTPRVQSSVRLNTYHLLSPQGYNDTTYETFINSLNYKTRGMVYAGANDGMLHAFKLGALDLTVDGYKAWLCEDDDSDGECESGETTTTNLGKEEWAFIPKNALPYLKYLGDSSYCHLYYVDASSYIFDAAINKHTDCTETNYYDCTKQTKCLTTNPTDTGSCSVNKNLDTDKTSWKTILIGGMGQGGACRKTGDSCTDCVKTPITDPADSTKGLGFSSYFAMDVTDPANPKFLWEFSDSSLGFSTSGPAIVRVGDSGKNGRWFAIFASGPTGPIDTAEYQFLGKSDQNLKLFVVDLKAGTLLRTIDTGITEAFGGSLFNAPLDVDRWDASSGGYYSDDVIYLGYTKKCTATRSTSDAQEACTADTWTDGGVLRIITKDDQDPNNWTVSKVIENIGPVTTSIAKLQNRTTHKLWLSFGTGRFFYKLNSGIDDADAQRALYSLQEACYTSIDNIDNNCSTSVLTRSNLDNQTTSPSTSLDTGKVGWFINLDASTSTYKAERVITDPLAAFSGVVFFTTFAPNADVCTLGGSTYLWAVKYETGVEASESQLQGQALIQVSTGSIEEIKLSTAFTGKEGRRSAAITGIPPKGQGLSVVINPRPIKKILHIQEK
jgi:type IV pilus assembly protein PilY1